MGNQITSAISGEELEEKKIVKINDHQTELDLKNINAEKIENFDVSFNRFNELILTRFSKVKEVNATHNLIQSVYMEPKKLKYLTNLIINNNRIELLVCGGPLERLYEIDFSFNNLKEIPEFVFQCENLKYVKFANNNIEKLVFIYPTALKNIQDLNLSNNKLDYLPSEIKYLVNLKILNVSKNKLTKLPKGILECKNLEILECNSNKIKKIPDLSKLNELSCLNLSDNEIESLESLEFSGEFVSLKECDLSKNKLKTLPPNTFQIMNLIEEFNVDRNQLKEIPSFNENNKLKQLTISMNQLEKLPDSITTLKELTRLNLSSNRLNDVSQLNNMKLEELIISFNPIETLPQSQNIKHLYVDNCAIKTYNEIKQYDKTKYCSLTLNVECVDYHFSQENYIYDMLNFKIESEKNKMHYIENQALHKIGYSDMVGKRSSMEDSLCIVGNVSNQKFDLVGLFDGHGGTSISERINMKFSEEIKKLSNFDNDTIYDIFKNVNESCREEVYKGCRDGSTVLLSLISTDLITIMNLGDSRAVLSKNSLALDLSKDHKPNNPDERKRIEDEGGFVQSGRVDGTLAVARALGDFKFKCISFKPDITEYKITEDTEFLILACDGVWDVLRSQDAVNIVRESIRVFGLNPMIASHVLKLYAYNAGSSDNITVIITLFSGAQKIVENTTIETKCLCPNF